MNVPRGLFSSGTGFAIACTSPTEGAAAVRQRHQSVRSRATSAGMGVLLFCCLVLGAVHSAQGQSTFGSVRGTVQDSTGAAIPGTQLVLHSVDENTDRSFT